MDKRSILIVRYALQFLQDHLSDPGKDEYIASGLSDNLLDAYLQGGTSEELVASIDLILNLEVTLMNKDKDRIEEKPSDPLTHSLKEDLMTLIIFTPVLGVAAFFIAKGL